MKDSILKSLRDAYFKAIERSKNNQKGKQIIIDDDWINNYSSIVEEKMKSEMKLYAIRVPNTQYFYQKDGYFNPVNYLTKMFSSRSKAGDYMRTIGLPCEVVEITTTFNWS